MENLPEIRNTAPLFCEGKSPPSSPKMLTVKPVNVHTACELNKTWHSRMPLIHWSNVVRNQNYVCYIAEYDYVAYAVAIWSSPVAANRIKNGDKCLELRRLAISGDAPRYTATRMISKMVKDIKNRLKHIHKLISYQDTAVHSGTIYKAAGWHVGGENKGLSWSTEKRQRNKEQSLARKIRWEFDI